MTTTRFFHYGLTLRAPLLVSTVEGDPNSVRTRVSVPGSTLRGAVATALRDQPAEIFHDLVLSGRVRYLDATPCPPGLAADRPVRALPVPRCWQRPKAAPGRCLDLSWRDGDEPAVEERQLDDQLVPVEALHVVPGADAWLATPRVTMRFHHQRDRRVGRATEDTGAVFTYEALEEGTVLIGAVAIAGESQGELKSRLERVRAAMTAMRLGRSRRTQYGGSPDIMWLSDEAGEAREVTGWEEALDTSRDVRPGEVLRLLLTSDAIVRDPLTGQVDPRSILTTVSGSLGLAAGDVSAPFLGVRWVSGFNAKWGLALPQVPAVAAGSVVVLAPTRDVPAARLRALEERGLGERRAEGFGACLWLGRAGRNGFSFKGVDGLRGTPSRPDGEAPPLVRKIEARLLATDRQRAVEWLAARLAGSTTKDIPSRAILGRIRQALRHDDWEQRLTELMSRSSGFKPKSRRQLEACRLGGEQEALWLDQWLEGLVSMNDPSGAAERPRERLTEGRCLDRHLITRSADAAAYGEQYRLARRSLAGAVLALLAKRSAGGGDR